MAFGDLLSADQNTPRKKKRRRPGTDPNADAIPRTRRPITPGLGGGEAVFEQRANRGGGGDSGKSPGTGTGTQTELSAPITDSGDYLQPRSPLGQGYQGAGMETLFANPQLLSNEYMNQAGVSPQQSGGMSAIYDQLAQVMPSLFYLTQGGSSDLKNVNLGRFADYAQSFLDQMTTPGGGVLSSDVVGSLFNSKMEDRQGHPTGLGTIINDPNASSTTQAQRVMGLISAGLSGLAPGVGSGVSSYIDSLSKDWINQQLHSEKEDAQTFIEFLRDKGVDQMFR